jgi:acyl-CoA synthetase (NDP forming)
MGAVANDPGIGIIAMAQDAQPQVSSDLDEYRHTFVDAVVRGAAETSKPVVFFSHLSTGLQPELVAKLRSAGISAMQGTRESLLAIQHFGRYGERRQEPLKQAAALNSERISRFLESSRPDTRFIGERETKLVLKEYGIPVTGEQLCQSAAEAVEVAAEIGFPVVLKVESPDILHKSDVGGVVIGLQDRDQVRGAYEQIMTSVRERQPDARIDGILVAEQAPPGVELFVGISQDPQFGPVLLVGLGGILVELLNQVTAVVPPLTEEQACELLRQMPGSALLKGYRGYPPADVTAAAQVLVRAGEVALDGEGLFRELDINPLIVGARGMGCRAVDARLILDA